MGIGINIFARGLIGQDEFLLACSDIIGSKFVIEYIFTIVIEE